MIRISFSSRRATASGARRVAQSIAAALAGALAFFAPARASERWCDLLPRPGYAALERVPVSDDWFQVYKVAEGVYAIYEPYQFQEVISYLILGSERAILFDTGMGIGRIRPLVESLTSLPIRVVNSHTHFDHVGGNAEFDAVLGMDTRYTRRSAAGMAHEEVRDEVAPEALCRPLPQGVEAGSYRIRRFKISAFLKDGDVLDLGERRLEVLAVPGHTPDALALLDRESGLLWTGDAFYEGEIWLFVPETDLRAYGKSVRRLADLVPNLRILLTAHNTPVAEPRRLEQLEKAFESVRAGSVKPHPREGGRVEYKFEGFSLLLKAPGAANHGRVAALRGAWQRCFVRGRRWTAAGGDPAFRWDPGEPEVEAMLLVSDQLPSAWPALDRFEGSPYRRRLVPVRAEDAHHVAFVYESLDQTISE